jgi:hypothetical protein
MGQFLQRIAAPSYRAAGGGAKPYHWASPPVIQKPFQCEMLALTLASALRATSPADVNR